MLALTPTSANSVALLKLSIDSTPIPPNFERGRLDPGKRPYWFQFVSVNIFN